VHGDSTIGYIQEYPAGENSAGIDLFVGEVEFHHRGFGAPIIRQFLKDIVFADPSVEGCIIDPSVSNRGAIRAYEKAGFRFRETIKNPGESEPVYMMGITREEFANPWRLGRGEKRGTK
jgi:aminoglycoside 6'-N-acetyltransferase